MALTAINLPCPTSDGSGAATAVTTLALTKTIIISGTFNNQATIIVEASGAASGSSWVPIIATRHLGVFQTSVVASRMRVTIEGFDSTAGAMAPTVDIAAEPGSPSFLQMTPTAGNGTGAAIDCSAIPDSRTLFVTGTFTGVVAIEGSQDNVHFFQVYPSVVAPAYTNLLSSVKYLRAVRAGVGAVAGTPVIWIAGTAPTSGSVVTPVDVGPGSVSAPSIYWGTANTGMYSASANELDITIAGTQKWLWDAAGAAVVLGAAATPSISFIGDRNTGIYSAGADQVNLATGGVVNTSWTTQGFGFTVGTVGAPGIYALGDTDTGIYSAGANTLNVAAGGQIVAAFSSTGFVAYADAVVAFTCLNALTVVSTRFATGSVGSPGVTINNTGLPGIYSTTANALQFSVASSERVRFDNNTTASQTAIQVSVAGAAVQRVKVGAADSGGTGLRALVVDN